MRTLYFISFRNKKEQCFTGFMFLLCIIILFSSCKKDNTENYEIDDEFAYNIAIQQEYAETFNSLLNTQDSLSAASSTLNLMLKDLYVSSGKVTKQAIFIDYTNGTRGGILFNPQDNPNAELDLLDVKSSLSDEALSATVRNKLNTTPISKRTIFINPHYFERKKYTDKILQNYEAFLPPIGYDIPERYFNEECTLDLFTSLAGYGFIHIYSHGTKFSDDVIYLLTGETPNGSSNKLYEKSLKDKNIVYLTSSKHKTTKYYIAPSFFSVNDLSKDKPLVFGGFCYSFMGDWDEYVVGVGASAYVGYDGAVYSAWHQYWATNIMYYLTYYKGTSPITLDWCTSYSPMPKMFFFKEDSVDVMLCDKKEDDVVLWDWENLNYKAVDLSLKVNRRIEDSDGSSSYELWDLSSGYNFLHNIDFESNKYVNEWNDELFFDRSRSGNVEIVVSPGGNKIANFQLIDTIIPGTSSSIYIYKFQFDDLPLEYEDDEKAIFKLTGTDACSSILNLEYEEYYISGQSEKWKILKEYDCIIQDAIVSVTLYK